MVFRLFDNVPRVSRDDLADPNRHVSLEARLIAAGAPDLRDNAVVMDEGGGYVTILPKDASKRWTASPLDAETTPETSVPKSPHNLPAEEDTAVPAARKSHEATKSTSRRRRRA
jgi:hypothetical protein